MSLWPIAFLQNRRIGVTRCVTDVTDGYVNVRISGVFEMDDSLRGFALSRLQVRRNSPQYVQETWTPCSASGARRVFPFFSDFSVFVFRILTGI